jgi:hypothetical protein
MTHAHKRKTSCWRCVTYIHASILSPARSAPVIKFDSDYVFEAAPTRHMCARMGVGVQFSPHAMPTTCSARPNDPGAQSGTMHLRCSTEWPSRTLCRRALSAWLCACVTVPTVAPSVLPEASHSLSLRRQRPTNASKFRVFGCTVFAKVPDKLRRKLSE